MANAANEGCVVTLTTADCPDVPPDGIDYTSGVKTVNTSDGTPGSTTVTSGKIGINLTEKGVNHDSPSIVISYDNVIEIDINPDPDDETMAFVLADADDNPILADGEYIIRTDDDPVTFSIDGVVIGNAAALAQHLQGIASNTGESVTGSLTVNNPGTGSAASFSTTNADGIHVESRGGNGGNGGCTTILLATWCDDGDGGGGAGSVAVNNDGTIVVNGTGYGVSATSVGGTGGNGGGSFGLFASDAGSGGNGGDGADVSVVLGENSNITTWGNGGHGVYAVSNGGNGGSGGEPSGAVALGDSGGNGGDAGEVTVTNQGIITTHGTKAYGIFAQSMGAGAGSGSDSGGIVAIGGNGGGESSGNKVTVSNSGTIETWGVDSFGILAQSIGGGGGDGGSSGGLFAVGGRGGSGGGSDLVKVFNSGTITTHSSGSAGIFAQSVGGGGGNGGNAYSGSVGVSVAVGGNGGLGGTGGKVVVNELDVGQTVADLTAGTITTGGERSHGIQAQSIGGGGGNGGFAVAASIGQGFSLNFALGGDGAKGGSADTVTVNEKGHITTTGNQANGIFAQSVGGGGGSGGGAVAAGISSGYTLNLAMGGDGDEAGHGSVVTVKAMGGIDTTGDMAHGILAQSLGGGGGNGGFSVAGGAGALTASVGLGGSGAGGGNGSTVTVDVSGSADTDYTVHTRGNASHGIFAQSVGGGGGSGGFAVGAGIGGGSISVSLGGIGAGGGLGGAVDVANEDTLLTEGNGSYGILAQSIGGGGGNGGFSFAGAAGVMAASVAVGGKGGAGGNGGGVTVDNFGDVTTLGDLSFGVLAQSIGGGGGNGGGSVAATMVISVENIPGVAVGVAIGGAGGTASIGGHVILNNDGSITTGTKVLDDNGTVTEDDDVFVRTGNGAHALFAQSVGGGGGTGGFAGAGTLSIGTGASFSVAVGGSGGSGGDAGVAELTNTGDAIHTWGDGADGIHAQSIGGGGGDGGFGLALAASIGGAEMTNISVGVAIGGTGGAGGTGNQVIVDNSGDITTDGAKSNGIFAQSIGGGGGTGGFAASGTVTVSETAAGIGVSVGGGGGSGNFAQKITVDNSGAITTYGKESLGILAQSIGGGGGNGGLSVVAQIGISTEDSAQIGVSIGGGAGSGSYGGEVDIGNLADGDITTYGFGSHGILAQSIGGGGGKGGLAVYGGISLSGQGTTMNAGVSVGGNGGTGGYGNTVTVVNDGNIRVVADNAMGVVAQSIGGGGGDGGGSIAAMLGVTNVTNEDAATYQAVVSVGGVGGSGNYAGAVNVTNTGTIVTGSMNVAGQIVSGLGGTGIFAQSVGGGGGIGGRANAINIVAGPKCSLPVVCTAPDNQGNNLALTASVGGNGGTGGDGGIVTVVNTGDITTIGDTADGIFAQSIGGGGGTGGNGILGTGELLPVPVELLFIPVGQTAIYKNISVTVGGNSGASGDGKLVDVTNSKNITTIGDYSNGIFAQSVGGGGGVGGKAVIGATGTIGVGGQGGAAGNGGGVTVDNFGDALIETFGVASNGIFAQSVGGGGGMAGAVDRALAAGLDTPLGHLPVNLGIGLAFGQGGGGGGDGGVVDVDVTGTILTHGDGAAGIFAQSVGGGGGVQGGLGNELPVLDLLSWHVGSNGDAGKGGVVTVDMDGMIATAGNGSTGIFAQSTGGTGIASDVTVTVDGTVLTAAIFEGDEEAPLRGYGSTGIMAQSAGWGGNGNVIVNLDSTTGMVSGGRSGLVLVDDSDPDDLKYANYQGIGVLIVDGNNNTVTNNGTITTVGGVDAGWAIYASGSDPTNADLAKRQLGGNEAISNFGTVTGSIDLGVGTNSFVNEFGGTFNSGAFAKYGDGNLLTNNGWMSTGGKNKVMTTAFNGDLTQGEDGIYGVDLDLDRTGLAGEADLIDIDGTLTVDGAVDLTLLNMGNALPGEHEVVIAKSETKLVNDTIELTTAPSLVVTYGLFTQANLLPGIDTELVLSYGIDFDIDGLNPNQSAIGEYINAFQLAGGSDGLEPLVASLIQIPDLETYQALLDQLSPEPYLINQTLAMLAGLQFENSLMSCKVQDGFDAEGQCAWASVNHRKTERAEDSTNLGFEQTSFGLSAGAQAKIDDHFVAGIGGSWEDIGTESNGNTSSSGNRFQGGAVFKGVWGGTVLAGAVTGGWSSQNVSRFVDLPLGPSYILEGTQDIGFASAHVRLSHSFEQDNWYVRPMVDVGVTQVSVADFAETGGPMALEIDGHEETYVTVAPSIELGGEMDLGNDAVLRSFIRVGALDVVLGTSPEISAGFADAPDGVAPFTIVGDLDEALFDVTLGFDVINGNGAVVRLSGDAKVGETIKSYGGSLKISAPF